MTDAGDEHAGKNAAFLVVVDRVAASVAPLAPTLVGKAMGQLVRGEALDDDAAPHRTALLRLCFLQHVLQPALQLGALVTSMMRSMLVAAGASETREMLDDIRVAVEAADEEGKDLRLWLLIDEGMRRGFEGTRAQAAARAPELFDLDDATLERLISDGTPRR